MEEYFSEKIKEGTVELQNHWYKSNLAFKSARYDIILGMPWNEDMKVKKDYGTRKLLLPNKKLKEDHVMNKRAPVTNIESKKFWKSLWKEKFVEIFHVRAL